MERRLRLARSPVSYRDRWMISYMDVLTILLIFFVAISARMVQNLQRRPDPPVKPGPVAAMQAPPLRRLPLSPPEDTPSRPSRARMTLLQARQKLEEHGLSLRSEPRGLIVSLPQAVLFPSGQDQVSPAAFPILAQVAEVLRRIPNKVSLVGHTDSVPIHNRRFKNNWQLSISRGLRLLELLTTRYGIPERRLSVSSDGAYQPRDPNDTAAGRAANRRVEIVILDESAQ